MKKTRELLVDCAPYYHNLKLPEDCQEDKFSSSLSCLNVPARCTKDNAVYNIMHYLVDVDFLPPNVSAHVHNDFFFFLIIIFFYYNFFF